MTHCIFNHEILIQPSPFYRGIIKVVDQCERTGTLSVTNDAAYVVDRLAHLISGNGQKLEDYIIVYQDSEGDWDGIGVKNEKFDDFVLLRTRDLRTACHRMNNAVLMSGWR